jgi:hypothetical protein
MWMEVVNDIAAGQGEGRRRRRPPPELHGEGRVSLAEFVAQLRVAAVNVEGAVVNALTPTL